MNATDFADQFRSFLVDMEENSAPNVKPAIRALWTTDPRQLIPQGHRFGNRDEAMGFVFRLVTGRAKQPRKSPTRSTKP